MALPLYGDGRRSDAPAIQEMLDAGGAQVLLPPAKECYLIDRPLRIRSGQELRLPRYCKIRLADGANCHMLENADPEGGDCDISVEGGIWDYNNMGQAKNPLHFPCAENPGYDGQVFVFRNVKRLAVRNLTFKDPVTFCCTLDIVSYFTVENIVFDFNRGNPRPVNMDGIHLDGNCHYGTVHNLKGACYDDLVALNADEGSDGPISHIDIDGLYAEDCHSAVRLLTVKNAVRHVHVRNVHGTFYQYAIGVTKYYEGQSTGYYDGIVLDNLFMSKAVRYPYLHISEEYATNSYVYPLIYLERGVNVRSLSLSELYRVEENVPSPTFFVAEGAAVGNLSVRNCLSENRTGKNMVFFSLRGEVVHFEHANVRIIGGDFSDG